MEKWKGTYLENFHHSTKLLPNDLRRNHTLMRTLEDKAVVLKDKFDALQQEILADANNRGKGGIPDTERLAELRALQVEIHHLNEEKIAVADQALVITSAFLARLETDLEVFEEEQAVELPVDPFAALPPRAEAKMRDYSHLVRQNPPPREPYDGEEVFCFCRQMSHGEMVACDGKNCEIEWFHMKCVGLEVAPTGKWYCQECRNYG